MGRQCERSMPRGSATVPSPDLPAILPLPHIQGERACLEPSTRWSGRPDACAGPMRSTLPIAPIGQWPAVLCDDQDCWPTRQHLRSD
jgi:hypothetical protein